MLKIKSKYHYSKSGCIYVNPQADTKEFDNPLTGLKNFTLASGGFGTARNYINIKHGEIEIPVSISWFIQLSKLTSIINGELQGTFVIANDGNNYALLPVGSEWYDEVVMRSSIAAKPTYTHKDLEPGDAFTFANDSRIFWYTYVGQGFKYSSKLTSEEVDGEYKTMLEIVKSKVHIYCYEYEWQDEKSISSYHKAKLNISMIKKGQGIPITEEVISKATKEKEYWYNEIPFVLSLEELDKVLVKVKENTHYRNEFRTDIIVSIGEKKEFKYTNSRGYSYRILRNLNQSVD